MHAAMMRSTSIAAILQSPITSLGVVIFKLTDCLFALIIHNTFAFVHAQLLDRNHTTELPNEQQNEDRRKRKHAEGAAVVARGRRSGSGAEEAMKAEE
jgi:hypothetical protein